MASLTKPRASLSTTGSGGRPGATLGEPATTLSRAGGLVWSRVAWAAARCARTAETRARGCLQEAAGREVLEGGQPLRITPGLRRSWLWDRLALKLSARRQPGRRPKRRQPVSESTSQVRRETGGENQSRFQPRRDIAPKGSSRGRRLLMPQANCPRNQLRGIFWQSSRPPGMFPRCALFPPCGGLDRALAAHA